MAKNKIMIVGHKGKMGSVVFELAKNKGFDVFGVDKGDDLIDKVDLVVDFSIPENTLKVAKWCVENKIPLVVGTTGHDEKQQKMLQEFSKEIPILKAGNFSIGMALLRKILRGDISKHFKEVVIYEKHHRNKKDSPSGTAVELKILIENNWNGRVEVLAERGGKEVGEHVINCYLENEVLSFSHKAFSRECFADGVLVAIDFMLKNTKRKMFSFDDIFWKVFSRFDIK